MGQTLTSPVTTKDTSYCKNDNYYVGSSCMQGWRVQMEDAHSHFLALPGDPSASFFAVYDGHSGAAVAKYAGKHLHKFIIQREEYAQGAIEEAMKLGFLDFDHDLLHTGTWGEQMAGSTAVVVMIKENRLYCANAGDSRAIAVVSGNLIPLSFDHKPYDEAETKRIVAAGGWVVFNRVNGNLALSRALGDFMYKRRNDKKPEEQIVTAYPDVEVHDINEDWEFIVVACDGIWDVMTSAEVADFVRKRIAIGVIPEIICEELLNSCLATDARDNGLGGDNMTVLLVCFLHNQTYENLVARCSSSMEGSTTIGESLGEEQTSNESNTNNIDESDFSDSVFKKLFPDTATSADTSMVLSAPNRDGIVSPSVISDVESTDDIEDPLISVVSTLTFPSMMDCLLDAQQATSPVTSPATDAVANPAAVSPTGIPNSLNIDPEELVPRLIEPRNNEKGSFDSAPERRDS